jgi:hypothetical protein
MKHFIIQVLSSTPNVTQRNTLIVLVWIAIGCWIVLYY